MFAWAQEGSIVSINSKGMAVSEAITVRFQQDGAVSKGKTWSTQETLARWKNKGRLLVHMARSRCKIQLTFSLYCFMPEERWKSYFSMRFDLHDQF